MATDKHPDLYNEEERQRFREIRERARKVRREKMNRVQRRAMGVK